MDSHGVCQRAQETALGPDLADSSSSGEPWGTHVVCRGIGRKQGRVAADSPLQRPGLVTVRAVFQAVGLSGKRPCVRAPGNPPIPTQGWATGLALVNEMTDYETQTKT